MLEITLDQAKLKSVPDGYASFLLEGDLARPANRTFLVHWVREFLLFAEGHRGCTFDLIRDEFLAAIKIGKRVESIGISGQ